MIGISACLGGMLCRYDGKQKAIPALQQLVADNQAVMICPEVLGGLPTPRDPAEIIGGDGFAVWENQAKVMTQKGQDVSQAYMSGAKKAYEILRAKQIDTVILKAKSPSCGARLIYDGSFTGTLQEGVGVATAYFIRQGIFVQTDEEWVAQHIQGGA